MVTFSRKRRALLLSLRICPCSRREKTIIQQRQRNNPNLKVNKPYTIADISAIIFYCDSKKHQKKYIFSININVL